MESITIKVDKSFAKEMEKAMKPMYATKSEFIRDAIRDKVVRIKHHDALEEYRRKLASWREKFGEPKKTTYKREREIRETVGRAFAKKFGVDIDYTGPLD
jgi:Arc/MetJ-type ribon-helix-helix transcriptional regulator